VFCHKIYIVGSCELRRHYEIAFVFPLFIVNQNNHAPSAQFVKNFVYVRHPFYSPF